MCNHYRNDIRKLGLEREIYGFEEFSELPRDVYPNRLAPVVTLIDGAPTWRVMRWGFPKLDKPGATINANCRNPSSPYWKAWTKPAYRCLVPFSAFAEPMAGMGRAEAWFAGAGNDTTMFAGVWRPWTGDRGTKKEPNISEHLLFAFLTCQPNGVIEPIHPKAMPVILPDRDAWDSWLTTETPIVMQRPLDDDKIKRIAPDWIAA